MAESIHGMLRAFVTESLSFTPGQFWPWLLSLSVIVCPCVYVYVCVNSELVRAKTHYLLRIEPPNSVKRYKRPWLRSLLFWVLININSGGRGFLGVWCQSCCAQDSVWAHEKASHGNEKTIITLLHYPLIINDRLAKYPLSHQGRVHHFIYMQYIIWCAGLFSLFCWTCFISYLYHCLIYWPLFIV